MSYTDRLKEARGVAGLSQKALAKILGTGTSTISGYEVGTRDPSIKVLCEMMNAMGVDANFIFQDEVKPKSNREYLESGEKELLDEYRNLNNANKALLLKTAHYLKDSEDLEVIVKKAKEWDARENRENRENPA